MDISQLLQIVKPESVFGSFGGKMNRLVLDSRLVKEGDVFIALRGTRSDGNSFIGDAIRRGACVVIAEKSPETIDSMVRGSNNPDPAGRKVLSVSSPFSSSEILYLQVADSRRFAGRLAQAFHGYPSRNMKMVGVTGTNGKTTVSTLVYQVLHNLGYHCGLIGTVETRMIGRVIPSHLTTPDPVTLAGLLSEMASRDTAFTIMEVSSHALEQDRVSGIRFDVGVFTNLSRDHLDYHRDMQSYVMAKKKLFAGLDEHAIAIINRDDPKAGKIAAGSRAEIWEFGFEESRDFRILDESPQGLVLDLDGTIVSSPLTGRYNAYNVAQAYLTGLALGCNKNSVAAALGEAEGAPGRLERVWAAGTVNRQEPGITGPAVFVDYAHTPDALENVLLALKKVMREGQILHVVFGCGGDRDRTKRPLMGKIADNIADIITITSDNPRSEDPGHIIRDIRKGIARNEHLFIEPTRKKAIRSAILESDLQTLVLIAGKGHETCQEIRGRRYAFDDRQIAGKALSEWIDRRSAKKGTRVRVSGSNRMQGGA